MAFSKVAGLSILTVALHSVASFASPAVLPPTFTKHHPRQGFTVGQQVTTSGGLTVIGRPATNATEVSEYLGIPFAQPPVGDLRFAAPQPYSGANKTINATNFSPDCPTPPGSSALPSDIAGPNAIRLLAELGQVGDSFSEDCLTLNIWTKPQTGDSAKAVLFWIYGGGFQSGATANPTYNGQYFADNQDVVVVSANYRVNVFGFPGIPGVEGVAQNPGLLDQRLAIEWVRDNIAAFGGDPSRITIFGQSAGGASVDLYNYAYVDDPIIAGSIAESGTADAFFNPANQNNVQAFFNLSVAVGCPGNSSAIEDAVSCVRTKPFEDLLTAESANLSPLQAVLGIFQPNIDNQTVFGDYPARAAAGNFIKEPYFIGNNDYEAGLFKILAQADNATANLPDIYWSLFNLITFTCPVADAAAARAAQDVPVYRYRYFGEFPNLRLTVNPSSGAWHGSEIPIIWGTAEDVSGEANTAPENSISAYLQGAWAAFAKDPAGAFAQAPYSYPTYNPLTPSLIEYAQCNATEPSFVFPVTYDLACPALEALDASVPGGLLNSANLAGLLANASLPANITDLGGGGGPVLGDSTPCPLPQ